MKKRILFVEDNDVMLQMLVMMLDGDEQWEVGGVSDGHAALKLLAKWPADVVVSDMRMPGMSGLELLAQLRQVHPRISRIIVSGIEDQEEIARSLGETHQFLAKPFTVKSLKATLSRIRGLDVYLRDEKLKALVGRLDSLPSFPSLYLELMKEIQSPDSSLESIAELVGRDPSLTVKILQVANSAAMGFGEPIHSPFQAVQQLGMNTVRALSLSAHVFARFEQKQPRQFSVTDLWNLLMNTGILARKIMLLEGADEDDADDAYTAGMLHDVGKLMLAENLPDQFQSALDRASSRGISAEAAEVEEFGSDHAGIAAYLLGLWGLPAAVVEAVALHHAPEKTALWEFTPLTAVHAANVLENEISRADKGEQPALNLEYLARLGVEGRLPGWRDAAASMFVRD